MSLRQERLERRRKLAEQKANTIVEQATERVVAARQRNDELQAAKAVERMIGHAELRSPRLPSAEPFSVDPHEVKRLRDSGLAWWIVAQRLGMTGDAKTASDPEAKRGAGRARSLYASVNQGEVPRSHAIRKGTTPKPTGPGQAGTLLSRKEAVVRDGHVIPRDMPDEDVEKLLVGRTIQWVIDLARLTETDPNTWGPEDRRWCPQEARVSTDEQWVYVGEEDSKGNRLVRFREHLGRDKDGKLLSGPTRTVRVDAIFSIR